MLVKELLFKLKLLLKYKDLIWQIAVNDLAVQYRHPLLGVLWIFLMPLFLIVTVIIVFSKLLKVIIPGYPFPIFFVTGMLPWNYFASALFTATTKISDSSGLVKNVYFPKEVIPFSIVLSHLINFIISLLVMCIVFTFFKIKFGILAMFIPFIIIIETILLSGVSLIVSSLQVKYRDIKYVVEVLLMIIFYSTPIIYPMDLVKGMSENFFKFYLINPFVGLISLYRIVFLPGYIEMLNKGNINILFNICLYPIVCSILIFVIGLLVFKKLEPNLADYL